MDAYNRNPNSAAAAAAALMTPTSTSAAMHHHQQHHQQRLPFGSLAPHQPQQQVLHPNPHHQYQQHQQQQQQQMDQKSMGFDEQAMRFGIEQQQQQAATAKKKRGRPRKYAPDGNIALGLAPTSPHPSASNSYGGGGEVGGGGDSGGRGGNANSSEPPAKRHRGRPPGSGKKQLDALGGTGGVGFTPHVIEVKTGEDIAMKIRAFSQQGPRAICILSANGSVCTVMLRQATNPNGAVKYEGRYEIISLSGSFMDTESNGTKTKAGSLSVSLAGPNGQIIGGVVAGTLVAGSQVQVIVGSFVSDHGKKQKKSVSASRAQNNNSTTTPEPASTAANMLTFGGGGTGSPRSQGGVGQHSSESSEENESNSSMQRGNSNNNNNHGLFGNSMPQPLHPLQMYHLWPSHSPQ